MNFDQMIQSRMQNLSIEDKRMLAELAEFLSARRVERRAEEGKRSDDWSALSLEALFADQDHPDEVDYSLNDISSTVE